MKKNNPDKNQNILLQLSDYSEEILFDTLNNAIHDNTDQITIHNTTDEMCNNVNHILKCDAGSIFNIVPHIITDVVEDISIDINKDIVNDIKNDIMIGKANRIIIDIVNDISSDIVKNIPKDVCNNIASDDNISVDPKSTKN